MIIKNKKIQNFSVKSKPPGRRILNVLKQTVFDANNRNGVLKTALGEEENPS